MHVEQLYQRGIHSNMSVAWHLRKEWGDTQPSKISILSKGSWFRRIDNHLGKHQTQRQIPEFSSTIPTPKDLTGARAWFGLVNQGAYAFSMAKEMHPYRHLLKPGIPFVWTDEINDSFMKSKKVIAETISKGVRLYDLNRKTCLQTDWSINGIGFMPKQKYCHCNSDTPTCCTEGWHLTLVGSRFTTPAESRYAPIEGEALAVVYGLRQTKYYTLGCPDLHVVTDHKPLLGVLGDRSLNEIGNRRLLNLKEKTLEFSFKIHHISGKNN